MEITQDQARLRGFARAVLAACLLLLGLVAGAAIAVRAMNRTPMPAGLIVRPLPPPVTLAPSAIVAAGPAAAGSAAPAAGVTGTTALPAMPVSAAVAQAIVARESGVTPARPFAFGRAGALDRARALQCLTSAIYYEAATESDAGQRAVAQVVLNRARHPAFPATICGVVYQGSEQAGCQFSFACDGALARAPARAAWARAAHAAGAALAGYVFAPVGLATHYHTYAVTPSWSRGLVMTDAVGAHFFHRWKGYWGTAAAFRRTYAGAEPLPAPHPTVRPAVQPPAIAAALSAPPAAPPPVPARTVTTPRDPAPATATGTGTDESQILPRWRDSGKPIDP